MNTTTDKLAEALRLSIKTLEDLQGGCTDSNDGTVEALTVWCPEVITELYIALDAYEAECSNHPDAPHGFDRNASHNEGRYVCECESWSPPAAPAAPSYLTRDTVVSGVRVIKVWPVGSDEPQILGTTIGAAPAAPAQVPLTDEQIEGGRSKLFSVGNPFCPITEKAMRTAVRWAERCHGIGAARKGEQA
jgi:hypothetical protein